MAVEPGVSASISVSELWVCQGMLQRFDRRSIVVDRKIEPSLDYGIDDWCTGGSLPREEFRRFDRSNTRTL